VTRKQKFRGIKDKAGMRPRKIRKSKTTREDRNPFARGNYNFQEKPLPGDWKGVRTGEKSKPVKETVKKKTHVMRGK